MKLEITTQHNDNPFIRVMTFLYNTPEYVSITHHKMTREFSCNYSGKNGSTLTKVPFIHNCSEEELLQMITTWNYDIDMHLLFHMQKYFFGFADDDFMLYLAKMKWTSK